MTEDHMMRVITGRKWAPVELETLLKVYYLAEYYPTEGTPAEKGSIKKFENLGLVQIQRRSGTGDVMFELTPRGSALVALLLNTPIPVEGYLDPRSNQVIDVGGCLNG